MSLADLLQTWRTEPTIARNVTAWHTRPARAAQTAPLPAQLHPALVAALRQQGIESLYSHQAESWATVQAGQNPVIVTGTASGKTLAYNLPVLHHLLADDSARALYLFPTKALAHDQKKQLSIINEQLSTNPLATATYDGDTPQALRPTIRAAARVVLTNPDMLHTAVLPHHTRWAEFLRHLRFVVLDEMHVYRGVFGSHVANVLRRLQRIINFYQGAPNVQFILTSATIANPAELAERLIEAPVTVVENDGAARGAKHFVIYNPPIVNPELGIRRSVLQESVRLAGELLSHNVQTIVFGRTRRTVELLLTYLRTSNAQETSSLDSPNPPDSKNSIRAYRSGYLPRQRREIEQGLRSGRVQAVAATSALELGIDIGGLDAAVLAGYPGTIAGTWQQAGRAGRQQADALAVLVASASPLDQFLAHHPRYFFERSPEAARLNPDNLLILLQHLRCAAFELPFNLGENFGRVDAGQVAEFLQFLRESGEVHQTGPKFFWMAAKYPAEQVSLRSASPASVKLLAATDPDQWTTIGEVDAASAPWMVHPQAIYLHEGQSYRVEQLDLEQKLAHLRPAKVDYYTEPKQTTTVSLIEVQARAAAPGGHKTHGEILVTRQVTGYNMVQWFSHEQLGSGEVNLPPSDLHTTGYWLSLAESTVNSLRESGLWSNDPNNYGPNWAEQRNAARARDGYRCQVCGAPEQGRQHDVHHKIPFRQFASYRLANRLENLVTLCRTCHQRAEAAVKMRSGLAGLATVLGQLAPLFLMCDAHDLGLHAEPQSPLAEGLPVVVIYEMAPGGIGFAEELFNLHGQLIAHARELVLSCGCADGCPSCVGPAGEDGVGGKRETLALLQAMSASKTIIGQDLQD
ncbi:MAG: ATP-dependent RNA helicase DbpA [Anaerolineae bacterium]|nr:ATP-dependent RNA helicase DbpA [Anaerolineae bacterium]